MTEILSITYLKNERQRLEQKIHRVKSELVPLEERLQLVMAGIKCCEELNVKQIHHKTFFADMTMVQASEAFLMQQGRACTSKEIVQGLLDGGFQTRSKDFRNTLISAFGRRLDIFVRAEKNKWDLVSRVKSLSSS